MACYRRPTPVVSSLMKRWRQARPHWDFAAELLLKAAQTRGEADIEMVTAQMERALRAEGWL
jgi:hypothetical protein